MHDHKNKLNIKIQNPIDDIRQRGASDSVTDFSVLSNPSDAQNVYRLVSRIFARIYMLDIGWVLLTHSCHYLCNR